MFFTNEDCTCEVTEGEELPMTTMISHVQLSTSPSSKDKNQLQANKVALNRIIQCPPNLTSALCQVIEYDRSIINHTDFTGRGKGPLGNVHQNFGREST